MTLRDGAATMGRKDGAGHARPPIDGLTVDDQRSVVYYLLFPNTLISLHPDYVMLHTLWPRAPRPHRGRVRVVLRARDDAGPRLRPVRRGRLLGPGQPRGLARVRDHAEGHGLARASSPGRYTSEEFDVHEFDVMVADRYMEALAGAVEVGS